MMGSLRRHVLTRAHLAVAVALTCALACQNIAAFSVRASSQDPYDLLTIQLNDLVGQRAATMRELGVADGAVGSILARDILASLKPVLGVQQDLVSGVAQQVTAARAVAARPTPLQPDRSILPGSLLGAHQSLPEIGNHTPVLSPDELRATAWRQSLLTATGLTVSSAVSVSPVITGGSTYTSFVSGAPQIAPIAPPPPSTTQALGTAQDLISSHSVEVNNSSEPLTKIAPQAIEISPPATLSHTENSLSQTPLHGMAAVDAYMVVARGLPAVLSRVAYPTSLMSAGLDPSRLVSDVGTVQAVIGTYDVPLVGGNALTSPLPVSILPTFSAPQVTWSFTSTSAMTDGATLLTVGSAEADGGAVHAISLNAYRSITPSPLVADAPSGQISLSPDGVGLLRAVVPISGTTNIVLSARVPGLAADASLQGAQSRERLLLAELSGEVQTGNALYGRLKPMYDAQLAVYSRALAAVVSHNSIIEQAWWNATQRYADYQTAHAKWLKRQDAWNKYFAQVTTNAADTPFATPTDANPTTGEAPPAGVTGFSSATPDATAEPSVKVTPGRPRSTGSAGVAHGAGFNATLTSEMLPAGSAAMSSRYDAVGQNQPIRPLAQGYPSPALTPVASDTPTSPQVSATANPAATQASGASDTNTPVPTISTGTAVPLLTDTAAPSATADASATPAAVTVGGTALPDNTGTASATITVRESSTPRLSPVSTSPTATVESGGQATAIASQTPTVATGSASATATPGGAGDTGSGRVSERPTGDVPPPPGPEPASVPAPGPEPVSQPLPPPLAPLPGWLTPSVAVSNTSITTVMSHGLGPTGYANLTQQQLLADGVFSNVAGYHVPLQGVITTYFGGSTPWQSFHTGVDIATNAGTPIRAAAGGIVLYAGLAVPGVPTMSYGNCVVIMHNAHVTTLYGHMEIGAHDLQVRAGEVVSAGQIIGYEGATGWATGPHLHFEMRIDNVAFDPLLLVDVRQITG